MPKWCISLALNLGLLVGCGMLIGCNECSKEKERLAQREAEKTKAFSQGRAAYLAELKPEDNPYKGSGRIGGDFENAAAWLDGYIEEKRLSGQRTTKRSE